MTSKTYKTTEICKLAGVPWWRLDHLVRSGQVVPLNRVRGQERRFSGTEALKAIELLKAGSKKLEEKADDSDN